MPLMRRRIPNGAAGRRRDGNSDGVWRDDRRMFGEYCGFGSRAKIAREEQRVVLRPPMPAKKRAPLPATQLDALDRRAGLTDCKPPGATSESG